MLIVLDLCKGGNSWGTPDSRTDRWDTEAREKVENEMKKAPTAPPNLTAGALAAWRDIHRRYRVHQDCIPALTELVEALSRKEQAQTAIAEDGILVPDRFGVKRPHAALVIERDCRLAILRCLKVLGLPSVEESRLGRPPLKDNR